MVANSNNAIPHQDPSNTETQPPANVNRERKLKTSSGNYASTDEFHLRKTILVLNFQEAAKMSVINLLSLFGDMELYEIITARDATTCLAVIQYADVASAENALLAVPEFKIRGVNLDIRMLWHDRYNKKCHVFITHKKRKTVFIKTSNCGEEKVRLKCSQYGDVQGIAKLISNNFTYKVLFRSALSAAVATYCLQTSSGGDAALLLGYDSHKKYVVAGPICDKPLDKYESPLSVFDVNLIQDKFEDYSKLEYILINSRRTFPTEYSFFPGVSKCCACFYAPQPDDVSIYLDMLLFDKVDEISTGHDDNCKHRSICKLTFDFDVSKPVNSSNEKVSDSLRYWKALFILDLEVYWDYFLPPGLRVKLNMQRMNHVGRALLNGDLASGFFREPVRCRVENVSAKYMPMNMCEGPNGNLGIPRIVGYADALNFYQIPVDVSCDENKNMHMTSAQDC